MFYSYDILNVRTGKLSLVWLAANRRVDFKRNKKNFRELIGTNISVICDEIMKKVTHGGKTVNREEVALKFSLYLSSMLMSGTVRIYDNQVRFLLEETMLAYVTIRKQKQVAPLLPLHNTTTVDKTQYKLEQLDPSDFGVVGGAETLRLDVEHFLLEPRNVLHFETDVTEIERVSSNAIELLDMEWNTIDAAKKYPHLARMKDITLIEPICISKPVFHDDFDEPLQLEKPLDQAILELEELALQTNIFHEVELPVTPTKQQRINEETPDRRPATPEMLHPKRSGIDILQETIAPEQHITSPLSKRPLNLAEDEITKKTDFVEDELREQTDQPAAKRPRIQADVTMELDVVPAAPLKRRSKKKRKLAIDHFRSFTQDELKENRRYYQDTLRVDNPLLDVVPVHLYKNIIPAAILLQKFSGGLKMGKTLQNMMRAVANLSKNFEQIEILRHQHLEDASIASSVSSIHSNLQDTGSRASKSAIGASLLEHAMETAPEPAALQPMSGLEDALIKSPSDIAFEADQEQVILPAEAIVKRGRSSPDAGPVYVQVEADIHAVQTPQRGQIVRSPYKNGSRISYPLSSPVRSGSSIPPEISLSPIEGPAIQVVLTPTADLDGGSEVSPSIGIRRKLFSESGALEWTLCKILPPRSTRKDVVATFMRLMEMHKAQDIRLKQEECYGPIHIEVLEKNFEH